MWAPDSGGRPGRRTTLTHVNARAVQLRNVGASAEERCHVVERLADDVVPPCADHDAGLHGGYAPHDAGHAWALSSDVDMGRHGCRPHRSPRGAILPSGTIPVRGIPR